MNAHTYTRMKHTQPTFHFLITNILEWHTGTDLSEMLKRFEKQKMTYWVWFVPVDSTTDYEITFYQPQVEGSMLLQAVEFIKGKRQPVAK